MRRAVFRRTSQGVALFPFLAVLICTMGSLIVLLVLVLQNSRSQADAVVAQKVDAERQEAAEHAKRIRNQLDEADWRREMLEQQRAEQVEELANRRKELSHLEDHIRRLEDQWKKMREQAIELQRLKEDKEAADQATQEELDKIRAQVAEAKKKLEEARKKKTDKPQAYAIIPYVGKSGTRRRPIYIECAEEGIILYPERVVFLPSDFQGSLGPGNPLDAALRTVREYWAQHGDTKRDGEPYPLLIVRPNGAIAYSMARAAMRSWDEEFGYELIEEEMKLQFPPPDPQLEALIMRSIADARQRQTALAAAMPSRYRPGPGDAMVASPNGGFVAAPGRGTGGSGGRTGSGGVGGGGTGGGGTGNSAPAGRGFGATGASAGAGMGGTGAGGTGLAGTGLAGTGPNGDGSSSGTGRGFGGSGTGGTGTGTGTGGAGNLAHGGGSSGTGNDMGGATAANGGAGAPGGGASFGGSSGTGGGYAGASGMGGMFTSHEAGQDPANGQNSGNASSGAGSSGGSGRSGGTSRNSGSAASGYAGSGGTASGQSGGNGGAGGASSRMSGAAGGSRQASQSSGGGQSGVQTDGASSPDGGQASATFSPQCIAQSRGRDWALMGKSNQATAITRPIRVRCQARQLVILPERGVEGRPQPIAHEGEVGRAIEPFVTAVRKHMDGWGLAVAGGYWKPVLNVQVDPDAESQFSQLETLLQDSGYEVVRKTTR